MTSRPPHRPAGRVSRGERTRRALMNAALDLVERKGSFAGLSLRQVARRAGVVPTAFYRHFPDMDSLGVALVDDSFHTLRQLMRETRKQGLPARQVIRESVATYVRYVRANHRHFRFVVKERFSGNTAIREAIRREIRLFVSELATDLSRFPLFEKVSAEDLRMIAGLIVNNMTVVTEQVLELPPEGEGGDQEEEVLREAEKQLRLVMLGAGHWKSRTP